MKSDLRKMATYEDAVRCRQRWLVFRWCRDFSGSASGFSPSQNVTVTITDLTRPAPSWTVSATHSQSAKGAAWYNGVIACINQP